MGEFIEANGGNGDNPVAPPKVFTQEFFDSVIKKSIDNGDIPEDHRLVFIAATDESGAKAIVAVSLITHDIFKIKINGIFEHQWDGDNRVGAKVIFSIK